MKNTMQESFTKAYLLILLFALPSVSAAQSNISQEQKSEQQEWVVVLEDPRPSRLQGWVRNGYSKSSGDYRGALELKRFGKKIGAKYSLELRDEWFIPSLGVYCLVVKFNGDQDKTISYLKKDKSVQWIQPSNNFNLLNAPNGTSTISQPGVIQNNEHSLKSNNLGDADGAGVVIAIIDSAVDISHPDLKGQISQVGDFVIAGTPNSSGEVHWTAIAGIMIADKHTKLGVAGVAPAATLQSYRGCWESAENKQTNCNTLSLARALDAVMKNEVDILNLSLSGPKDPLLDRLLQRVIDRGTLVVTAFDPNRPHSQRFPTKRDGVLVVRARGLDDKNTPSFTAPGARVVLMPGNRYDYMQGHSVASAYTSGLLALRKQVFGSREYASKHQRDWRNVSQSDEAEDLLKDILSKS